MSQQQPQQKGGKKAAKQAEPIVVKDDVFLAKYGRDLRNKIKKMDKIVTFKKASKKGGPKPDENQQAMLDSEAGLKDEIDELKATVALYKQSNPNWEGKEEVKQEDPAVNEQRLNSAVQASFAAFARLQCMNSFGDHMNLGEKRASVDQICGMFQNLNFGQAGNADKFGKAMSDFMADDWTASFLEANLANAQAAQAAANKPKAKAEPVIEVAEPVAEEVVEVVAAVEEPAAEVEAQAEEPAQAEGQEDAEVSGQRGGRKEWRGGENRGRGGARNYENRGEGRGGRGGDRGGRGDRRGGANNRGYNRGPKQDDDGFMMATDTRVPARRGDRGGRGGRGGDRPNYENKAEGGQFRRGGNRGGGRGGQGEDQARPQTAPVNRGDNNKVQAAPTNE